MNKEDILKILEGAKDKNGDVPMRLVRQAFEKLPESCTDTISRQAAIDVLKGLPTWWADEGGYYGGAQPPMVALLDPEDAVSAIENLPSAQTELEDKILAIGYTGERDIFTSAADCLP